MVSFITSVGQVSDITSSVTSSGDEFLSHRREKEVTSGRSPSFQRSAHSLNAGSPVAR